MDKESIRKAVKERILHFKGRREEEIKIAEKIRNMPQYLASDIVLVYSAISDEVDLSLLFQDDKLFLFPYIEDDRMFFAPPPLKKGCFGISEPAVKVEYRYEKALMIAPARALSLKNERIGRGKGYYDRYIKENRKKLITIGVCYSVQLFESLPADELDQRVDIIISGGAENPD